MTKQSPWDKENPEQAASQEGRNDPNENMKEATSQSEKVLNKLFPTYVETFTGEDIRKVYKLGIDVGKNIAAIQYKKALKAVMDAVND